jgi:hypothetical protein
MIRFFTYSQFHNKDPVSGSTYIRVHQLFKYWPDAGLYKYGENPDCLIFQKVYVAPDYQFPKHFEGLKILDICDPDWMEGMPVKETIDAVDAVTVPSRALQKFIMQMTDKPVVVIADRFDMELIPKKPKIHNKRAKTVVWFGYSHNAELLRPAMTLLNELNLNLLIISNDDPLLYRFPDSIEPERYMFSRYNEQTIYTDLQKADFALLPKGFRPQDKFKSNNKTVKAILAGLPVANDRESVTQLLDPHERQKFMSEHYSKVRLEYDVKKSVAQYQHLIKTLSRQKAGK